MAIYVADSLMACPRLDIHMPTTICQSQQFVILSTLILLVLAKSSSAVRFSKNQIIVEPMRLINNLNNNQISLL